MRLRAEAEILENEEDNPESLSNRLRDFVNEPNDKEQPATVNQQSSLSNITEKSAPVKVPETTTIKGTLNSQVGQKLPSGNSVPSIYVQPSSNNLPRLKLTTFDGESFKWPDWSSMFKSMVGDANISLNAKMQHLQNSVMGKAKTSIEGYGYSGDSYNKALSELESRFGKPSLVIKATLGKLRTFNRLQDNDPESVRSYSDVVSTTVWTLSRFGYVSDLNAEANLSLATYKLSNELLLKWKEHVKNGKLDRPNLSQFSDWPEMYVQRFLRNCKIPVSERTFGNLLVKELEKAKKIKIRQEQIKAFTSEFQELKRGRRVHKQSSWHGEVILKSSIRIMGQISWELIGSSRSVLKTGINVKSLMSLVKRE
ncbi:Hypothetical predicted protein [Paramuricea clavata]|uniref:Uncharacterized protein n=1 Tax=Paramuricea clavata TaxID=317549 RepID=A0A6S7FJW8_PARCT|nr:Hypothetical predicted protein [Paramuricea clavata]